MSTALEVITLDEAILEKSVPCTCLHKMTRCTREAAFRVLSTCLTCGNKGTLFMCTRCHREAIAWGLGCSPRGEHLRGMDKYV